MPQPAMTGEIPLLSTDQKTKGQIKNGLQQTPRRGKSAVGRPVRTPGLRRAMPRKFLPCKPPAFCVLRRRATVLRAGAAAKRSDCSALTLSEKRNAAAGISGRAEEKAAAFPVVLGKNSGGPAELRKKRRFGQGQEKNSGGWRMVRRTAGCVSVRTEKRRSAAQRASGFCAAGRG